MKEIIRKIKHGWVADIKMDTGQIELGGLNRLKLALVNTVLNFRVT
jgi:hypothetical protein